MSFSFSTAVAVRSAWHFLCGSQFADQYGNLWIVEIVMSVSNKFKQMLNFHSFNHKDDVTEMVTVYNTESEAELVRSSRIVQSIRIYWLCPLSSGSVFMGDPLLQQPQAFHYGHVMQFITQVCSFLFQYICRPTLVLLKFTDCSLQLFQVFHES